MYRASFAANEKCRDAIEAAITSNYGDNRLDADAAVKSVLEQFSPERVRYILANTIQQKDFDGRIPQPLKEWAKSVEVCPENASRFVVDKANPGLTALFVDAFRQQTEPQKDVLSEKAEERDPEVVAWENDEITSIEIKTVEVKSPFAPLPEEAEKAPKTHRLTAEEKEIKAAVMDTLKGQIAYHNDGMRASYRASNHSFNVLARNGVRIEGNTVTQNGEPLFAIHRRHSAKKTQGCYRAGRERVVKNARHSTGKTIKQSARTTAKKTVKTAKHSVKAAEKTVKTTSKAAKTAAKATEKTAQAAAKAAQAAVKAAQAAAKAAAAAAKAAAKAIAAVIKWIIAAVKALIAAIAAGGWVAVVIIVVVVLVVALLAVFGVFSSNEAPDGSKPLTEAIETIDSKYQEEMLGKIAELTAQSNADVVELIFEGDMESLDSSAPNWADVVGVYATKLSLDTENPSDITVVTEENITELETIFYDMNSVSYRTETETVTTTVVDEFGAIVYDEEGEPQTESTTTLYIYIDSRSLDYLASPNMYL